VLDRAFLQDRRAHRPVSGLPGGQYRGRYHAQLDAHAGEVDAHAAEIDAHVGGIDAHVGGK
jgi:hypothetical protein